MIRLFWIADDLQHWAGYTPETGYVKFPAEANGWERRKPFHGFDPLLIREVPAGLAFNTGFPIVREARRSAAA